LKFLNQANELYVSESFSFFGFKNKQFPANPKPIQAFNSGSNKKIPKQKTEDWKCQSNSLD
jgi:hypothetical protein